MTLSDIATQHRQQEANSLKRFLTYSLAGSIVVHGGLFALRLNPLRQSNQTTPQDITIVVTDPMPAPTEKVPTEKAAIAINESEGEPTAALPAAGVIEASSIAGDGAAIAVTPSELPVQGEATIEPIETSPSPPGGTPSALASPEPTTNPATNSTTANFESPPKPSGETAPLQNLSPDTESSTSESDTDPALSDLNRLQNLLAELRRNREQRGGDGGNGTASESGDSDAVATANGGGGSGTSPNGMGSGSGADSSNGTGNDTGNTLGTGTGNDVAATSGGSNSTGDDGQRGGSNGNSSSDRPSHSGSRQVGCRNCPEIDYPESARAAGAEGTVHVEAETDSRGRVTSVRLVGSSGNVELDQAVLDQVRRRYRFSNTQSGERIPLAIDMTIEGSEANRRARRRGDRRQITVSEPSTSPASPAAASDTSPSRTAERDARPVSPSPPSSSPLSDVTSDTTPATQPSPSPATAPQGTNSTADQSPLPQPVPADTSPAPPIESAPPSPVESAPEAPSSPTVSAPPSEPVPAESGSSEPSS